ncbi:MAG: CoA-binding protein [Armatimonadota bacterium]
MNVAILGATDDPNRYAHTALAVLAERGHNPIPVNPNKAVVDGHKCYPSLAEVPVPIDTVTVYVGPQVSSRLVGDILAAKPRRAIFNPGAENPEAEQACRDAGIEVVRGCTLVMLSSGRF